MSFARFSVAIVGLGVANLAAAQTVTTAGACPGVVNINIQNLTPNGNFALLTGGFGGNDVIPAGPCAGTPTQLNNLALRTIGNLNNGGDANLNPNIPAGACGSALQVLDVGSCQLTAPTAIGTQCQLPNVGITAQGPVGQMTTPTYFGVSTSGIVEGGRAKDYTLHNNQLGTFGASSAITFSFFDANGVQLCTIDYDLSSSIPDNNFVTQYAAVTVDEVQVQLANGASTCGNINPATFGTADLRQYVEALPWSVGYGPSSAYFSGQLQAAVVGAGLNWNQDWAPFVFSTYVGNTGYTAFETSYTFQYPRNCDVVEIDNQGFLINPLAKPNGALDDFQTSQPYFLFVM